MIMLIKQGKLARTFAVAQLADQLLPTPEGSSSNPVIDNFCIEHSSLKTIEGK